MSNFQSPRGTQDIFYEENKKWEMLEELIRAFASVYHLKLVRTPIFEHTEVFKRGNDSSDMVNKEMYTFDDRGGRSLTLRLKGLQVCYVLMFNISSMLILKSYLSFTI